MKRTVIEVITILTAALISAFTFNYFSGNSINAFSAYQTPAAPASEYTFEQIDIEILKFYLGNRGTILLDARSEMEFRAGHIPGAYSFSLNRFEELFRQQGDLLKLGNLVITYCSGPSCNDSLTLASKLQEKGIGNIFVFRGGIEEWELSGNLLVRDEGK